MMLTKVDIFVLDHKTRILVANPVKSKVILSLFNMIHIFVKVGAFTYVKLGNS